MLCHGQGCGAKHQCKKCGSQTCTRFKEHCKFCGPHGCKTCDIEKEEKQKPKSANKIWQTPAPIVRQSTPITETKPQHGMRQWDPQSKPNPRQKHWEFTVQLYGVLWDITDTQNGQILQPKENNQTIYSWYKIVQTKGMLSLHVKSPEDNKPIPRHQHDPLNRELQDNREIIIAMIGEYEKKKEDLNAGTENWGIWGQQILYVHMNAAINLGKIQQRMKALNMRYKDATQHHQPQEDVRRRQAKSPQPS